MSLESSGCLVFIGLYLKWFGATVIEISHLEGRWHNGRNLIALFLENSFAPNSEQKSLSPFVESRWLIILQYGSGILHHLWLNRYNLLHKNAFKNISFDLKNNVLYLGFLVFFWYFICFNFHFGLWTVVSKWNLWSLRCFKMYLDWTFR